MSEVQESFEAAIANVNNKIAQAETLEEAQGWQSVLSNLNSIKQTAGSTPITYETLNNVVAAGEPGSYSFKDLSDEEPVQTSDETNTVEKE